MKWDDEEQTEGPITKRRFTVEAQGRRVPGVLWTRPGQTGRRPLVLVGHGGSQHKESDAVLDVVPSLVGEHGFAVAAIDGPIHGDRRADGGRIAATVIAEFRTMWTAAPRIEETVADWRAAIDALISHGDVDSSAIGWYGISMGTAYGVPLCATEPRIRAALLGMWGTSHAHGERLLRSAREVRCPVLFQRKRGDERFTPQGQEALFAAIASADKELRDYEGGHVNPAGTQLRDGLDFLRDRLLSFH